jgi:hypothetical protein
MVVAWVCSGYGGSGEDAPEAAGAQGAVARDDAPPLLQVCVGRSVSRGARWRGDAVFACCVGCSDDAKDIRIAARNLQLVHRNPHIYIIDDFLNASEYEYFEVRVLLALCLALWT